MPKIKVQTTKPMRIAYIEHTGDYSSLPFEQDMKKLFAFAKARKLKPGFRPLGIYLDPPSTPADKRRSQIAIPIRSAASDEGEIRVRELPPMEVAVTKHAGPSSKFQATYDEIQKWMEANGYEWAGAAMETYLKKPKTTGDGPVITARVQVPIRKR